jgi:hypothetical protein
MTIRLESRVSLQGQADALGEVVARGEGEFFLCQGNVCTQTGDTGVVARGVQDLGGGAGDLNDLFGDHPHAGLLTGADVDYLLVDVGGG